MAPILRSSRARRKGRGGARERPGLRPGRPGTTSEAQLGRAGVSLEPLEAGEVGGVGGDRARIFEPQIGARAQEIEDGEPRREARRPAGGQAVIGAGAVVAENLGRPRARKTAPAPEMLRS